MKLLNTSLGIVTAADLEYRLPDEVLVSLTTDMPHNDRISPLVDGTRTSIVKSSTYTDDFEVAVAVTVTVSPGLTVDGYSTSTSKLEREKCRTSGEAATEVIIPADRSNVSTIRTVCPCRIMFIWTLGNPCAD